MKQISFALTTAQFRAQTKHVTRRLGWFDLEPDDELMAVEKGQGLKKGEKVVQLGPILIVDVRMEPLIRIEREPEYGRNEMILEGFPGLDPAEFVRKFSRSHHCHPHDQVNRIEYAYMRPNATESINQEQDAIFLDMLRNAEPPLK